MSEPLRLRMEHTVYCSGPECETHQHIGGSTFGMGRGELARYVEGR